MVGWTCRFSDAKLERAWYLHNEADLLKDVRKVHTVECLMEAATALLVAALAGEVTHAAAIWGGLSALKLCMICVSKFFPVHMASHILVCIRSAHVCAIGAGCVALRSRDFRVMVFTASPT